MTCWIDSVSSSSVLSLVFVNEAPRALVTKTTSSQSQGQEATLLKIIRCCLVSRYQWESRYLRLKISAKKPCHILCHLGMGLDIADGVKAVFLEQTFRVS